MEKPEHTGEKHSTDAGDKKKKIGFYTETQSRREKSIEHLQETKETNLPHLNRNNV